MASKFDSSVHRGSDVSFDFPCFTCQGNEQNCEAEFYCEECFKFYCGKCVKYHNKLHIKHVTLGKENLSQWPVSCAYVDVLEQCQDHKKELTAFCESHSELLCHQCHHYNHQKCSSVIFLTEKVKALHQNGEFTQLSTTVDILHEQFIQKKNDLQERMTSVENSYHKIRKKISKLRNKINASLDKLEKNTIEKLNTLRATMKNFIQTEIHQCTESIQNMKCVQDDFQNMNDKSEVSQFNKYRRYMDQSTKTEAVLQEMTTKNVETLTFTPETTILKSLSTLSGLGQILNPLIAVSSKQHPLSDVKKPLVLQDQNQVIRVTGSKKYCVKTEVDKYHCRISGICVTGFGDLIITDYNNNQMKLLDQIYKVVALYQLRGLPWSMCSIDPSLVAVVTFAEAINEVHFIRVTNRMLFRDRTLKLKHKCTGIAHHRGNLFITSDKALYQYTMSGTNEREMFKVTNWKDMIGSCAISPDGERIYVAFRTNNQLVTLAMDGTVISRLTVSAMKSELKPHRYFQPDFLGLHVTDLGQVLVCESRKIIQVDRDGGQILEEMGTEMDDLTWPLSVYYSRLTQSLIVGMGHNDHILVVSTEVQDEAASNVLIAQKTPDEELMELLRILNIDTMAECRADSFPAFSHGRAVLQGIVTKGKDILECPLFSETQNQIMNCERMQLYTTASLLTQIEGTRPEIIKTIDYSENRHNILFPAVVIVEDEHQFMIEDWIKNIRKNIPGICVVLVSENQDQIYFAPQKSIFLSMTKMAEVITTANKLLERTIFSVLKHHVETLMQKYVPSTYLSDIEKESTLQSVYAYSRAAYQRSKVPECERLDIPVKTYTYPKNIDEVIKTLMKIQSVIACSKKCGILELYIDRALEKETTLFHVKELLRKEKIGATFEYGRLEHFFSSGDTVYEGEGALGGFAKRFPKADITSMFRKQIDTKVKLVALISKHVVRACSYTTENASLYVGLRLIGKIHKIPDHALIDIVPFDVQDELIQECDTRFQTETKKQMHGKLPENDDCLIGLPVFIWGAKSSPGLGILDSVMDMQKTGGVRCIKIHNRIPAEPFSHPGDSGAIVCATDPEASTLTTIAMVIGKFESTKQPTKQPTYFALLLKEAFAELNEFYESEFKMCEDDAATP